MKIGKRAPLHLYRSCLSKKRFDSLIEAEEELRKFIGGLVAKGTGKELHRLHTYPCDFAPHFHIGHSAPPLRYIDPDTRQAAP